MRWRFIASHEDEILELKTRLAEAKYLAGDIDSAEELLNKVITQFPMFSSAHMILAKLYLSKHEKEKLKATLNTLSVTWSNADTDYAAYKELLELKRKFKELE